MSHPFALALALTDRDIEAVAADPALAGRVDALGLAFVVAGLDRLTGRREAPGLDPTTALTYAGHRLWRTGLVAAGAPHRDHPYNLARRVASADHLGGGRAGLLVGFRDASYATDEAWPGDGLQGPTPLTGAAVVDAIDVIRELWQSWPADSIVADRPAGRYADVSRVRRVDHEGVYRVRGPLSVPTTPQGSPVLLGLATTSEEAATLSGKVDVLVPVPGIDRGEGPHLVVAEIGADGIDAAIVQVTAARAAGAAGALVVPTAGDRVADVVEVLSRHREAWTPTGIAPGTTLRDALGLAPAASLLSDAEPAFAPGAAAAL